MGINMSGMYGAGMHLDFAGHFCQAALCTARMKPLLIHLHPHGTLLKGYLEHPDLPEGFHVPEKMSSGNESCQTTNAPSHVHCRNSEHLQTAS